MRKLNDEWKTEDREEGDKSLIRRMSVLLLGWTEDDESDLHGTLFSAEFLLPFLTLQSMVLCFALRHKSCFASVRFWPFVIHAS